MMSTRLAGSLYRLAVEKMQVLFSPKYLLYTNTGISVGMSCSADFLQQFLQIKKRELPHWNHTRSRDVAVTGLMIGPFCHFWYSYLDKWFPGKTVKIVAKKVFVDQLVCSPVVIGIFLGTTLTLEGKKGTIMTSELYQKGKTLYLADWLIWPPAQAVNFFFLPPKFRVLYDNCISFLYDCYFSHVKYGKAHNISTEQQRTRGALTSGEQPSESHVMATSNEVGMVTGSHVPSINMQVSELVKEKTKRGRLKIKHIVLHTDNLATDLDVTVVHEAPAEEELTSSGHQKSKPH